MKLILSLIISVHVTYLHRLQYPPRISGDLFKYDAWRSVHSCGRVLLVYIPVRWAYEIFRVNLALEMTGNSDPGVVNLSWHQFHHKENQKE